MIIYQAKNCTTAPKMKSLQVQPSAIQSQRHTSFDVSTLILYILSTKYQSYRSAHGRTQIRVLCGRSTLRITISVVYEAVSGPCEFCEFAVISGYNSCQSSRKGYYVAGDISGCISDELALVWTQ